MADSDRERENMKLNKRWLQSTKALDNELGEEDPNTPETESRGYREYQRIYHPDTNRGKKIIKAKPKRKPVKKCRCK